LLPLAHSPAGTRLLRKLQTGTFEKELFQKGDGTCKSTRSPNTLIDFAGKYPCGYLFKTILFKYPLTHCASAFAAGAKPKIRGALLCLNPDLTCYRYTSCASPTATCSGWFKSR